jgi:copper chaperone
MVNSECQSKENRMRTTVVIDDMICGHCASTVAKAVASLDKEAKVDVDLGTRRVVVTSTQADEAELQEVIKEAGYTPVWVQPDSAAATQPKRSGCGCGCG